MYNFFRKDRALVWLVVALVVTGSISAILAGALAAAGESPRNALKSTSLGFSTKIAARDGNVDSWSPMVAAYNRESQHSGTMYSVFFEDHIKFQYPPSSLLLLDLFSAQTLKTEQGQPSDRFRTIVGAFSQVAVLLVISISALIMELGVRTSSLSIPRTPAASVARMVVSVLLGCTFFPVVAAHDLGQIQIYLDLFVAVAIGLFLLGQRGGAGFCLGLCVLIKPQFGVVLLWALLRKQWTLGFALGATIATGLGLSLLRFGWSNHVEYFEVLRSISRLGETYWPNQSVNGILNRLMQNGSPVNWTAFEYAPYNRPVYIATLCSSLALLAIAFWPQKEPAKPDRLLADFMIAMLVATMASPVAWQHHYGILLPFCAALLPILLKERPLGRWTAPLFAAGFAAAASVLLRGDLVYANRWVGVAGSHLFFGSTLLLALLANVRAGKSTASDQRPSNAVEAPA